MKRALIGIFLLCMAWAVPGFCHPHVFVDASVVVQFDQNGLASVRNHWVYDEMYSSGMIAAGDADRDGTISEKESPWFQQYVLEETSTHNYFNYILRGSDFLKAEKVKNFKASVQNKRLVLDFDLVFDVPVKEDYTMLVLVVADPSNYIQVTADLENADVSGPDEIDVEYFDDSIEGLTMLRAFQARVGGLYLRFKKK